MAAGMYAEEGKPLPSGLSWLPAQSVSDGGCCEPQFQRVMNPFRYPVDMSSQKFE